MKPWLDQNVLSYFPQLFPQIETWVEINDLHKLTSFRLFIPIKGFFLRILCWNALSSLMISIFKVHQARLRGDKIDVVVKDLMMTDIRNLQAFALYI
ncbi:hypothetical protein E1A91_A12G105400v1 [Gossypium mustelinum]|uniref:Uncharacterized protein n=2 Tax=Gossypium TaxID=3633 RepID=A0A5D2WSC2_GOSMU|nr:hypothetical protein ES332_A12G113600v1 [Gossypium tomentosum]TYJ04638.1 hypothetical protein E1A91_A12G105400v1 [Gossypium mustelinum]